MVQMVPNCAKHPIYHGAIIRTGITCKKIPLTKSIEFGMALKYSATRFKQKAEIFLVTRLNNLLKT